MLARFFLVFVLTITATSLSLADHHMAGMHSGAGLTVDKAWARASVGKNGAAYFTLVNRGRNEAKLVRVTADVARRVELHTHKMDGNIMRMRPLEHIIVSPGSTVSLKPGGHHVMLMGLKRRLKEGDSFPLILLFENAGKIQVSVKVGKIGASGPAGGMKSMDRHGGHRMEH